MRFPKFVEEVIRREGGYVNDPHDHGGETKFGISKRSWPKEDIKNLTRKRAAEIYEQAYWDPRWEDATLLEQLAFKLFDLRVNMGSRAISLLQRALHHFDEKVKVDGQYGPVTHQAVLRTDQFKLYDMYMNLVQVHYENLAKAPKQSKYLKGWLNRLRKVYPAW